MSDILDILRDWYIDAQKNNPEEAVFIKQIIDEISSLRYLNQNPGKVLTVGDWEMIDKMFSYSTHKKSCANIYGRCTCGFTKTALEYDRVRNPQKYKEEQKAENGGS